MEMLNVNTPCSEAHSLHECAEVGAMCMQIF
jgi:hypothetical protein